MQHSEQMPTPTLPGRYRVRRHLASGGMASVWCADDLVLGRRVAIKILSEPLAHDETARRRFKREARAAARVSTHPHVVTIFDVGELESGPDKIGGAFIVMEHLAGGTVADALRVGAVRRREALRWLREAASALDHAHACGIVHRDVKPANFLLDRSRVLHVADFGIARIANEETITSGELLGTAAYLSPEQALGREATGASDRYALAVAAFELLCGERPFAAEHFAAQARQHIEDPPPRISARDRTLPPALDEVLARGMAKVPEERFQSATELVDALETALAGGVLIRGAVPRPGARSAKGRAAPGVRGIARPGATTATRIAGPGARPPARAVAASAAGTGRPGVRSKTRSTPARPDGDGSPRAWRRARAGLPGARPTAGRRPIAGARSTPGARAGRGARAVAAAAAAVVVAAGSWLALTPSAPAGSGAARRSAAGSAGSGAARRTPAARRSSAALTEARLQRAANRPAAGARPAASSPRPAARTPGSQQAMSAAQLQNLGFAEMQAGELDAAIATLRRALQEADPSSLTYAYGLYNLGVSLLRAGDPRAAIPILERRLRIPNQTATVLRALDQALAAAGEPPAAAPGPTGPEGASAGEQPSGGAALGPGHGHGPPGAGGPPGQQGRGGGPQPGPAGDGRPGGGGGHSSLED
ncbi:MAG TPA: serine/threonine-protein kinase [Solirubrobacteraceae bacterium]|nr:serine/threonine-protein kinase [Solirubrobacteraceae bacterium]